MRDKTPVEMGLCITIPQYTCPAENDYSKDNGYARWPATPLGQQAEGTCKNGWASSKTT